MLSFRVNTTVCYHWCDWFKSWFCVISRCPVSPVIRLNATSSVGGVATRTLTSEPKVQYVKHGQER